MNATTTTATDLDLYGYEADDQFQPTAADWLELEHARRIDSAIIELERSIESGRLTVLEELEALRMIDKLAGALEEAA